MGKLARLALAASAVVLAVLPPFVANAAPATSAVDVKDNHFVASGPNGNRTDLAVGDAVRWNVIDGTHTVTADDKKSFEGSNGDIKDEFISKPFSNPGTYRYYCEHHGAAGSNKGMWGEIVVVDPSATTTTTTTVPPTTSTTAAPAPAPSTPPPAPTATTTPIRPNQAAPAPAPTTTTKPAKKDKETTTTTVPPTTTTTAAPPPVAAPVETTAPPTTAPPDTTTTLAPAPPAPAPEGNAVAVIEDGKPERHGKKLLIASGGALGALGLGTGIYKWRNRSSRYWPA